MTAPESFLDGRVALHCGDSREVLKAIPSASIDSVVTDPPYALVSIVKRFGKPGAAAAKGDVYARAGAGFMGKQWDTGETAFAVEFWQDVYRVLKPGGHVVAFSGTRTYHRLACAIEDAGFDIRDSVLDLMAHEPEVAAFINSLTETQLSAFLRVADLIGFQGVLAWVYGTGFNKKGYIFKGEDGKPTGPWGGALKPAWEPIVLARKPLIGTVADNIDRYGTGALNVDGCRIGDGGDRASGGAPVKRASQSIGGGWANDRECASGGRWPANVVHDGSDEVAARFPDSRSSAETAPRGTGGLWSGKSNAPCGPQYGDAGSASRFFYSTKADDDDRLGFKHPTVKPVDLMQWLVRLVTPPGGRVLDPFAGTGTTGEAAWREGFGAVLIEREEEYQAYIRRRMDLCLSSTRERKREASKARATGPADLGPLFGGGAEAAE